ncbi:hypothetical protein JAAARDRAFT_137733, partial [Jaapia argillacea MUCL 33604]
QWRHLKMLKRGGCGHNPLGVRGTKNAELSIVCPACPHPGINLPDAWNEAPREMRYVLLPSVSNDKKDPGLGTGWSYFVDDHPYKDHLLKYTDQKEMSTCTGLATLNHTNTKFSKGYAVMGVGAVSCVRHEFILGDGIGDIQVGERFVH